MISELLSSTRRTASSGLGKNARGCIANCDCAARNVSTRRGGAEFTNRLRKVLLEVQQVPVFTFLRVRAYPCLAGSSCVSPEWCFSSQYVVWEIRYCTLENQVLPGATLQHRNAQSPFQSRVFGVFDFLKSVHTVRQNFTRLGSLLETLGVCWTSQGSQDCFVKNAEPKPAAVARTCVVGPACFGTG